MSDGSFGPIFGVGHDLLISNEPNANSDSTTKLGHTYRCRDDAKIIPSWSIRVCRNELELSVHVSAPKYRLLNFSHGSKMCEIEARFCSVFHGLKYSERHSSRCSVFTFHSILSAWVQVEAT